MPEEKNFLDTFVCPIEHPKSLEDWYNSDEGECPPCTLGVLAGYYAGVLEAGGATEERARLQTPFETGNPLTVAQEMDKIKGTVREPLKESLAKLDCFSQTLDDDDKNDDDEK